MKTEAITLTESKRLIQLEKIIKAGEQTFVEVGTALLEVRDAKLYRADYETFEEYCKDKWGWGRQRGYELILAAKVVNSLPEKCKEKITNSNQAEALAAVPPPRRAKVLEKVVESGKPVTAANIAEAAKPPPKKNQSMGIPVHLEFDEVGSGIPDRLLAHWNSAHEVDEIISCLSTAKKKLKVAHDSSSLIFAHMNCQGAMLQVQALIQECQSTKPYALCPSCRGKNLEQCTTCKHTGFISKFLWDTGIPEETKAVILKANKK